jgi:hypothetical protein
VFVTALEVRFEGAGRLGIGSKTFSIPYESIERLSTSVNDDVVRGKKHVSKHYSKRGPFHSVTLTVRQRKGKSVKQRVMQFLFFCENDALEVFSTACKLFNTVSEDLVAERRRFRPQSHQEEHQEEDSAPTITKVVSKAVALFDFADPSNSFSFNTGDIVYLTTEKRDLRVRGRLEHGNAASFFLLPRDYVEPIVWVSSVKNLPTEADFASIFSCGERVEVGAEQVIVKEGEALDGLFLIEVCI